MKAALLVVLIVFQICVVAPVFLAAVFSLKGVRGNGRVNGTINGPVAVRGNGASGVSRSPQSSVNSLAIQEPTAAEYASIRKYRKVKRIAAHQM